MPDLPTATDATGPVQRVGVFGGTFDPPHNGHLVVAANVRAALDLDEVLLVVANEPWQKVGARRVTPAEERLGLVEALCEGIDGVVASDLELRRGGPSYTVDTLHELQAPDRELFLVLGRDAAAGLPTWERVEEVRGACTPVLVERPGVPAPELPSGWSFRRVDIPRLDVSSSEVRERIEHGLPVDGLVPHAVIARLVDRCIYRGRP